MAYVEAHAGLKDHLKTKKVARLLGIPKTQVIGHMLCLWWWCQEYAQDGDLSGFDNADIAEAAEWEGDPDLFVNTLLNCGARGGAGFLRNDMESGLTVNDWLEYGGKMFVRREQSAQRMRNKRQRDASVTRNTPVTEASVTHIDKIREEEIREDEIRQEQTREEQTREEPTAQPARSHARAFTDAEVKQVAAYLESNGIALTPFVVDSYMEAVRDYGIQATVAGIQAAAENGKQQKMKYVLACIRNKAHGNNGNGYAPLAALANVQLPPELAAMMGA